MKFTKSIRWRLTIWIAIFLSGMLAALDFAACQIHFAGRIVQLDGSLQRGLAFLNASLYPLEPLPPAFGNRRPGALDDRFGPPPEPDDDFRGPPPDATPPPDQQFDHQREPGPNQGPDLNPNEMPDRKPVLDLGGRPPDLGTLRSNQIATANRRFAGSYGIAGFYYCIWSRNANTVVKQSTNCPPGVFRPNVAQKDTGTYARTRVGYREMYHTTEGGNSLLVGYPLVEELAAQHRFANWLVLGSLTVLGLGLGGAWIIIGRALRPVDKISAAAQRIAAGNLAERISAEETDSELGQLAGILNSTFARLETAFAQQKQFTADAAHELRTPLAVLISEAQTTLARDRTPADYRESISASLETAQAMRRLTDSLLELARFDAGQVNLHRETVNLAELTAQSVDLIRPLAAARKLEILCELTPAEVLGDSERLAQVATNLLTNAIHYNREGGNIRVNTQHDEHHAILIVKDSGYGIPAAHLPHIFKRFYRANRSRTGNHSGLGLAIVHSIVQAHGGTIQVTSVENAGSTFTIHLPLAPPVPHPKPPP
jgi:heavy metal sensor kinase